MSNVKVVRLPQIIGKGYKAFWNFEGRYRVLKGGRGSKKSTTAAFWFVYNMMKFFHKYGVKPHTLVIRRFYNTHKDSTYAQLKWCINQLGVDKYWKAIKSPLELNYLPSGQKIIFRGLDDPQSITSITADEGNICWTWFEEAFQITDEDAFDKIDMSIRGSLPKVLFKQHTLTFNPWSEKIWLKARFFDQVGSNGLSKDKSIMALTRNYDCNEFLGDDDLKLFEWMKHNNPRRYNIEGQGNWGIAEGVIFDNWIELEFDVNRMRQKKDRNDNPIYRELYGMDFGYTNDPTAFIALLADEKKKELYIFDEMYKTYMKNRDIYNTLKYKGYEKARICADSADPKSIDELKELGLSRIFGAKKVKGSVKAGIQKLRDYKMYVHPDCINTIVELNNYIWAPDKMTGKPSTDPADEYNHCMDALRYATEELNTHTFSW